MGRHRQGRLHVGRPFSPAAPTPPSGPNVSGAYQARLTGKTRLVGIVPGGWPKTANIAVTLKKGNGLVDAVQASLNGAIANGSYLQVLDRWAESDEKIAHSEINPPGLGD